MSRLKIDLFIWYVVVSVTEDSPELLNSRLSIYLRNITLIIVCNYHRHTRVMVAL